MGTTPIYAIPYTEPSDDVATYPAQDRAQAEAVEAALDNPVWCDAQAGTVSLVNNSSTDVPFTTVIQEPAGQWTSGTGIKIVKAGLYQVTIAASWAFNGIGSRNMVLKINGAPWRTLAVPVTAGNGTAGGSGTWLRRLALNDILALTLWQNSGGTLATSSQPNPSISLNRIGA